MKLTVLPYTKAHLDGFVPREAARQSIDEHGGIDNVLDTQADKGLIFSVLAESRTIGIIGAYEADEGLIEVWTMFSDGATNHPKALVEAMGKLLDYFTVELNAKMLYALVKIGENSGLKWGKIHGFKQAGMTPTLPPNGDRFHVIYRRAA